MHEGIVQISNFNEKPEMQKLGLEHVNFNFGNVIEMIFHSDGYGSKYDGFEFLLACKGLYLINTAYLYVFDVSN